MPDNNRQVLRPEPSPFRVSGPIVEYIVEDWDCGCRTWPIVVATVTYKDGSDEWPRRESWHVRRCGNCGQNPYPRS